MYYKIQGKWTKSVFSVIPVIALPSELLTFVMRCHPQCATVCVSHRLGTQIIIHSQVFNNCLSLSID